MDDRVICSEHYDLNTSAIYALNDTDVKPMKRRKSGRRALSID